MPRKRTTAWLLQLIEEIYDAAHEEERPRQVRIQGNDKRSGSSKKQASSKKLRAREELERKYLYYDGKNVMSTVTMSKADKVRIMESHGGS